MYTYVHIKIIIKAVVLNLRELMNKNGVEEDG